MVRQAGQHACGLAGRVRLVESELEARPGVVSERRSCTALALSARKHGPACRRSGGYTRFNLVATSPGYDVGVGEHGDNAEGARSRNAFTCAIRMGTRALWAATSRGMIRVWFRILAKRESGLGQESPRTMVQTIAGQSGLRADTIACRNRLCQRLRPAPKLLLAFANYTRIRIEAVSAGLGALREYCRYSGVNDGRCRDVVIDCGAALDMTRCGLTTIAGILMADLALGHRDDLRGDGLGGCWCVADLPRSK